MNKFKLILIGLVSLISLNTYAVPIVGTFDMGGGAYLSDATGHTINDASLAVAINFRPNNFRVLAADGDFTALVGNIGNIQNLAFASFTGPMANFWTIGGYSFDLTSVTQITSNDPSAFLVLNGTGIIRALNFDNTPASWRFSSDTTGNGGFSWSAKSATSIPEPGILALLSIGLIGLGLRKKIKY